MTGRKANVCFGSKADIRSMSDLGGKRTFGTLLSGVDRTVQHLRQTAKLLAFLAALWGAFAALAVGMSFSDGSWQSAAYTVLVVATPIAQVMFIGAGTVQDTSRPRAATILYVAAILCLLPVHLLIAFR